MSSSARKRIVHYLIAAVICAVFSTIYGLLSHGVSSPFMTFLCLIPAIGGLPAAALRTRFAASTWASGIATLTLGSCFMGVLEIYGTTSSFAIVYLIAGVTVLALALASDMAKRHA